MALSLQKIFDSGTTDFKRWAKRIIVGGGGVVGAQALSAWACTKFNDHRVFQRICGQRCAAGQLVSRGAQGRHFQRRPGLMKRVSRLLQPGADLPSDAYYCILGAPNSGKTHIVRLACEEVGAGVIYVQVTVPDMFASELAQAIDFQGGALNIINTVQNNLVKAIFSGAGGGGGDGKDAIDTAIDAMEKGARAYQAKYRRPVVLVLDDVDRLAEKQPGLLEELQGHAKAWSNAGLLRVVFVLSDGPALSQMKRRSAWSRANVSGFVTVDDVSEAEALKYLTGRGVDGKDAAAIFRVAGGRIGLLSHLATSVADMGIDCEEALQSVVEAAADEFKVAGLLDQGPRRDGGMDAINALLDAGGAEDEWSGISVAEWSRLVPQPGNQKALLASRVFVRHYPHQAVMFGSRPSALYARYLARGGSPLMRAAARHGGSNGSGSDQQPDQTALQAAEANGGADSARDAQLSGNSISSSGVSSREDERGGGSGSSASGSGGGSTADGDTAGNGSSSKGSKESKANGNSGSDKDGGNIADGSDSAAVDSCCPLAEVSCTAGSSSARKGGGSGKKKRQKVRNRSYNTGEQDDF